MENFNLISDISIALALTVIILIVIFYIYKTLDKTDNKHLFSNNDKTRKESSSEYVDKVDELIDFVKSESKTKSFVYKPPYNHLLKEWVDVLTPLKIGGIITSLRGCDVMEDRELKLITRMFRKDVINYINNPKRPNKYITHIRYSPSDVGYVLLHRGRLISPHWEEHMVLSINMLINNTSDTISHEYWKEVMKEYYYYKEEVHQPFIYRLMFELLEVSDRLDKLQNFILSDSPRVDDLHKEQEKVMLLYKSILTDRLERLNVKDYDVITTCKLNEL